MGKLKLSQLAELKEAFHQINDEEDDVISVQKLYAMMHSFGYNTITKDMISTILDQYDTDNKGAWDFTQFITYLFHHTIVMEQSDNSTNPNLTKDPESMKVIDTLFDIYDKDFKGYIDREDIKRIYAEGFEGISEDILNEMMDGAERITRSEFHIMMLGSLDEDILGEKNEWILPSIESDEV